MLVKILKPALFLLLFSGIILISCEEESYPEQYEPAQITKLLAKSSGNKWLLTARTGNDRDQLPCDLDDTLKFKSPDSVIFNEGKTFCNATASNYKRKFKVFFNSNFENRLVELAGADTASNVIIDYISLEELILTNNEVVKGKEVIVTKKFRKVN